VELPRELTEKATLRGNEFAWGVDDFPSVLNQARALGYSCLGGQFQFRPPGSTCEMYWLSADPDEREPNESLAAYAHRSCTLVLDRFRAVLTAADFLEEAKRWPDVAELSGPAATPLAHLCFVAYFQKEDRLSN
jgi:hypothetical protein